MTHPIPDAVEASARSSRGRRPLPVWWLLLPAAVLVAVTAVASALRCPQDVVSVLAALATLLLVIGATGAARREARARRVIAEYDEVELTFGRLGGELLPSAVERLQRGEPVEEVLVPLAPPAGCTALTAAAHDLVAAAVRQCVDLGRVSNVLVTATR